MKDTVLSIAAGFLAGAVFKLLDFPVPAPPNYEAYIGIVGAWLGTVIVARLVRR